MKKLILSAILLSSFNCLAEDPSKTKAAEAISPLGVSAATGVSTYITYKAATNSFGVPKAMGQFLAEDRRIKNELLNLDNKTLTPVREANLELKKLNETKRSLVTQLKKMEELHTSGEGALDLKTRYFLDRLQSGETSPAAYKYLNRVENNKNTFINHTALVRAIDINSKQSELTRIHARIALLEKNREKNIELIYAERTPRAKRLERKVAIRRLNVDVKLMHTQRAMVAAIPVAIATGIATVVVKDKAISDAEELSPVDVEQ